MIAALAQSQPPDFSFRSDLLRSKSIAKFIGKLDGGGRLQKEDLIYRDVDLDNREFELPEIAFEFRGPMWLGARQLDLVRWPAARLYALEFAKPEYAERHRARDDRSDRAAAREAQGQRHRGDVERLRLRQVTNTRRPRRGSRSPPLFVCRRCRAVRAIGSTRACSRPVKDPRRSRTTVDLKRAQDCESAGRCRERGAWRWLKNAEAQSPTVAQQAPSLVSELQKGSQPEPQATRAARRRMCVGVFRAQPGRQILSRPILASRDGHPFHGPLRRQDLRLPA